MSDGEHTPRELREDERALYGTLLRALTRAELNLDVFPDWEADVLLAMALAFAMHEGGLTKLALYPHYNIFGYKWIKGSDEGRYCRVSYAGNEIDLAQGDEVVMYRVFDSYDASLWSWHWAIFSGSIYVDLREAYLENTLTVEEFIGRAYARWSNNPDQEILSLYRDWRIRLRGGWRGTLVRPEVLVS